MVDLVELGSRVLADFGGSDPMVATLVTVGLSAFVMLTLRRTTGLPLSISALVVPFVVGAGFLVAVGVQRALDLPLLHAAALLAVPLMLLAVFYERTFGVPG